MIWVVDYQSGNVRSLAQLLDYLKTPYVLSKQMPESCNGIILPGVGNFGYCARALGQVVPFSELKELITKNNIPTLGICVGFQLLFSQSEEAPGEAGLNIFDTAVVQLIKSRIKSDSHVGWNDVHFNHIDKLNALTGRDFYFVHKFGVPAENIMLTDIGITEFCGVEFVAYLEMGNVMGCQFHPELSGEAGLSLMDHFYNKCDA